jgi:hypothetical protein
MGNTMTPSKVKNEPDVTPPPRRGLGFFQDEPETVGVSSASFAQKAVEPIVPDSKWQQCQGEIRLQRVNIKEQAAKQAVLALKDMSETLRRHLLTNPACKARIEKIGTHNLVVTYIYRLDLLC